MSATFLTPYFRLSFPDLFEAKLHKKAKPGDKPRFGLVMLFPKTTDLTAMRAFAKADIVARLGADFDIKKYNEGAMARNAPLFQNPFLDGDHKDLDGYKGCYAVRASSLTRPGVVNQAVQTIIDPTEIYPGCWCRATVDCYSWNNEGAGVRFGLLNVQKVKDDQPFGNRKRAEDDFTAVAMEQGAKPAHTTVKSPGAVAGKPAAAAGRTAVADNEWGDGGAGADEPPL